MMPQGPNTHSNTQTHCDCLVGLEIMNFVTGEHFIMEMLVFPCHHTEQTVYQYSLMSTHHVVTIVGMSPPGMTVSLTNV